MALLIGILGLSLLAALLALLLELADARLGFYDPCQIQINHGARELTVRGGTLLSAFSEHDIFIPSACGGRGSCGYCKVRVTRGGGQLLPTETPYLSREEIAADTRLACQLKIRTDLDVSIPPELFLVRQYTGHFERLTPASPDTLEIVIQLDQPDRLEFKPGQYIQLMVPEYDGNDEVVYRAYSIASDAHHNTRLRLLVTRVPEGIATTYLHACVQPGDSVTFNGPHGEFYLRDTGNAILFIATGSGLAPILSMLAQLQAANAGQAITLIFGARHRPDLLCLEELQQFAAAMPTLTFIPTLSQPAPDDAWEGAVGRVTALIEQRVTTDMPLDAYLCGNPAMVDTSCALLRDKGVPDSRIFFDKFE